jgi:sulfur relay (sulfurtransferase) DsrC/TusE family protein
MTEEQTREVSAGFDEDGFLKMMSNWSRSMAQDLADKKRHRPVDRRALESH